MHQKSLKKTNKLLFVQINEINKDYLLKGAKKYKCKKIISFFNTNKICKIISPDKIQDKNLDPWVQSVSINTGKISDKHKIFEIGQRIPKNTTQIWDILVKKKIYCSIWGTMNSLFKKNKHLKLYFPDPWNYQAQAHPEKFNNFLELPKYYAQNYLDFKNFYFLKLIFNFGLNIFFSSFLFYFLKNLNFFLKILINSGFTNYNLFFIFDIISLILFKKELKKNSSDFGLIFLNSFAHFQHNNWDEKKNEKVFFMTAEKVFEIIHEITKSFDSFLITNGFTQKKINKIYTIRPINPEFFLKNQIKINFKSLQQNMTNGGQIIFNSDVEAKKSIKILNNFNIFGIKFFKVKKINNKKIYYKIKIFSKNIIDRGNFHKINTGNVHKYLVVNKLNPKINKKEINKPSYKFFKSLYFIKTTGKHVPQGFLLSKNFIKIDKSNKNILNHKIFDLIKKYYS